MTTKDSTGVVPLHDVPELMQSENGAGAEGPSYRRREGIMGKIFAESPTPPSAGDLITGSVITVEKASVFVDLPPFGTGIIFGREFINARDIIKKIVPGDVITAKVAHPGNEEGYIELSLKEARQALLWSDAETAIRDKTIFELPIKEANKGGLILEWQGIAGFLPASQLKSEHYPRVPDGDKDKIFEELKKLVGARLHVSIITATPKEGKLIFSEKQSVEQDKGKLVEKYTIGDILEGEVTGIVDFGVFVKIEDGLEGLVHISEIDWALVEDPRKLHRVGETVRVKVIEIKDGKVSLSLKALKENPWVAAANKYKKIRRR
ncbi:MAG: RNA binding S1 protein [Parcubacteria group bacterium Gr01-1014_72]|nr:MAG: RNA binding S1 protein [Parcubacteria group bacterium Gr01-1014_72]